MGSLKKGDKVELTEEYNGGLGKIVVRKGVKGVVLDTNSAGANVKLIKPDVLLSEYTMRIPERYLAKIR